MEIAVYDSQCWIPKQEELRILQTEKMEFYRTVKGCSRLNSGRNDDIQSSLEIEEFTFEARC